MVDYGGLAVLVIGGYILIRYGPQIAQNLQQQQQGAAGGTTAGAAPAADTTATAPPAAAAPAPTAAQQLFPPITINTPAATPPPPPKPTTQQLFPSSTSTSTFPAGTKITCVSNTEDAACGDKGHPKCCPGQTLLGTPLQMVAGSGPAVSTRAPKVAPPPRTPSSAPAPAATNAACGLNPCGGSALVPTPGKCYKSGTTTLIPCNQSASKAAVAYANVGQASRAYLTQVVQGKKRTTIDPFFPAGWYNTQANYRGSLKEPGIRGGI